MAITKTFRDNQTRMKGNAEMNWTRISNNVNGNPRYVIHFLQLLTDAEMEEFHATYGLQAISQAYIFACQRAKKIGGKRYHNKQYGGGIVFQSYNLPEIEMAIDELKGCAK